MNSSKPSTCAAMNGFVERAEPFQLRGERPCQQYVGAGQQLQVQIGLLGDLGAQRIDDNQPAALAPCDG